MVAAATEGGEEEEEEEEEDERAEAGGEEEGPETGSGNMECCCCCCIWVTHEGDGSESQFDAINPHRIRRISLLELTTVQRRGTNRSNNSMQTIGEKFSSGKTKTCVLFCSTLGLLCSS